MTELFDVRPDAVEESGMQWQAVDSSQISKIGYESKAEYPLAIQFPPNAKQKAAGQPGSIYRYDNVTREQLEEFVNAKTNPAYNNSIGVYFGRVIKGRPDLFPFVKVEEGISETLPLTTPLLRATEATTEPPTTSIALAIIDTIDDELLFTPGAVTDAQLAAGREWYLAEAKKYDISTDKGRTELKRFARPLQKLRTGIEARAKELTGATKRKIAAIDAEKRRLVQIVGGIEEEVLSQLKAREQEEESRKARLAGFVSELASKGSDPYFARTPEEGIAAIEKAITELESFDLSTMQEYKVGAESAIAASLRVLKPELERRKVSEAQAAELAELRKKQAERDEADRIAAAAEKLAAEKMQAAVAAAKVEIRQEVIAELSTLEQAIGRSDRFVYPEAGEPYEEAPLTLGTSHPQIGYLDNRKIVPMAESDASCEHRHRIMDEAVDFLVAHKISRSDAMSIVSAIADGLVPHISIQF